MHRIIFFLFTILNLFSYFYYCEAAGQDKTESVIWFEEGIKPDSIYFKNGFIRVKKINPDQEAGYPWKYGFADISGRLAVPLIYYEAGEFSDGLAPVVDKNKLGFVNTEGKVIIPLIYDKFHDPSGRLTGFCEGLAIVMKGGKAGFIDTTGSEVIPPVYDAVRNFSSGLAAVVKGRKLGYVDRKGKIVIPLIYDADLDQRDIFLSDRSDFHENRAAVKIKDRWGYIDSDGKEIVQPKYTGAESFHEGMAAVCSTFDGKFFPAKWGFIDLNGKEVVPLKYSRVYNFKNGLAKVNVNSLKKISGTEFQPESNWGLVDKKGNESLPVNYGSIFGPYGNIITAHKGGRYKIMNTEGKVISYKKYPSGLSVRSDGFIEVLVKKKAGLLDNSGREIVPPVYDDIGIFSEGCAVVHRGYKCGYIDTNGKLLTGLDFNMAYSVSEGVAVVQKGNMCGIMKNPVSLKARIENVRRFGSFIGIIKEIKAGTVTVAGTDISFKVRMGDRLVVDTGKEEAYMYADFPMMTIVQCRPYKTSLKELSPGMKVYRLAQPVTGKEK